MGWFRRAKKVEQPSYPSDPANLEYPLLWFTPHDPWRLRDACEGVQIFGGIGSGKTSGSGQTLAKSFLRAGYGGLILTAKTDECDLWRRYCRETGREKSLIVFSPEDRWRFNFLDYEMRRPGRAAGYTENLVNLFYQVLENADKTSDKAGSSDPFWERTLKQLLRNAFELVRFGTGKMSMDDIYAIIQSAPLCLEETRSKGWQENSFCFHCIERGENQKKTSGEERDFELSARFWLREYPTLNDKTRSIVTTSFTSMADCFLRGVLNDLFCQKTNLVPELTQEGVVIVLDLPIKEFDTIGRYAQVLFKLIWQRAMERRNKSDNPRPVFLWADESHNFVVSSDVGFQTTARDCRICTVYLTQNLPNYQMVLDGTKGKAQMDSLLGCLQTKIFHCNGDVVTNQWAADVIAQNWSEQWDYGSSHGGNSGNDQDRYNLNRRRTLEPEVLPIDFQGLTKGGPEFRMNVEGYVLQTGRTWTINGKHHVKVTFSQENN